MLEIRIKKPEDSIGLNDRDDIKECYLIIVENIQEIVELFSICIYLVYYEVDALQNYISKYIFDTINRFIRFNEISMNFFEDLGLSEVGCENFIFPLKDSIKKIRKLFYQGKLITYLKSDNRSFFDFVKRILHNNSKGNGRKKLKIDYSKYLYYKVIMENEIFYRKDFKLKKNILRYFPQNCHCQSLNDNNKNIILNLVNLTEDESNFYCSNTNNNTNNKTIFNVSKYLEEENLLKKEQLGNLLYEEDEFLQKLTGNKNNFDKLNLFKILFLKNVKIEKDGILDTDSLFEFFFRVLNESVLKREISNINNNNSSSIDNIEENCKVDNNLFQENKNKLNDSIKTDDNNHIFNDFQKNEKNMKEKFFMQSLKNNVIKYITYKGFFNIDIILNEDEFRKMRYCLCCSKKFNNSAANCFYKFGNCFLGVLNSLFKINEGLIHKHFAIFSHSYNFNSKNRIYAFNSNFDASKKNKIRIYDVLFNQNWGEEIAKLIIIIYKEFYGMENSYQDINLEKEFKDKYAERKNHDEKEFFSDKKEIDRVSEAKLLLFMEKYKQTVNFISKDFLECYNSVLPDFKSFCKNLAIFPISRYNIIDRLCQHFTNSSVQVLLNKSIMFFMNISEIKDYNKKLKGNKIIPNLEVPLEPYLINIDKNLKKYLMRKSGFDDFINKIYKNEDYFITELKNINKFNENSKNILMTNNHKFEFDDLISKLKNKFTLEIDLKSKFIYLI